MHRGECLCRTVRYEVRGPWQRVVNCHCSRCRKHHGSLFATHLIAESANFLWLGGAESVADYRLSANGPLRAFCKRCGSTVPALSRETARIPLAALDPKPRAEPAAHIFVDSKSAMCEITDALPRFAGFPSGIDRESVPRIPPSHAPGTTGGSCLCGDVAFEIAGGLERAVNCHCGRCQRSRGAAYGTNLYARADLLTWTKGADQVRDYKLEEARFFTVGFCARCGSLLPAIWGSVQTYFVPAGCLDTEPAIFPGANIFTDHALAWTTIPDTVPRFPQMVPLERFSEFFFALPKR